MSSQAHARTAASKMGGSNRARRVFSSGYAGNCTRMIHSPWSTPPETTISNFTRDPDMTWLQQHFGDAEAAVSHRADGLSRAGWIFGGAGGRAVVFARNAQTGHWVGPAFYNIGAASVGFQAGVSVSETVTLVMTEKGLNSLLANSVQAWW